MKHIRVSIYYHGSYCDEGACPMWSHSDREIDPTCAAFGSLSRTKGNIERGRWPRSVRASECVATAFRLTEDGEE